jgi:hypothetical protein
LLSPYGAIVCSPDGRRFTLCSNSHPITETRRQDGSKKEEQRKEEVLVPEVFGQKVI